jgi:hypothetical protein
MLTVPCGTIGILPMFQVDSIPNEVSILTLGACILIYSCIGLLNKYIVYRLLQMFQVWFLFIMSTFVMFLYYSIMLDVRFVSALLVYPFLIFSILLDAYPAAGRFLAGVRFYFIELAELIGLIAVLFFTDAGSSLFEEEIGSLTFSGAALCMSCLFNLLVFGLRNTYQLFKEPACLVVLATLIEYAEVTENEKGIEDGSVIHKGRGNDEGEESPSAS